MRLFYKKRFSEYWKTIQNNIYSIYTLFNIYCIKSFYANFGSNTFSRRIICVVAGANTSNLWYIVKLENRRASVQLKYSKFLLFLVWTYSNSFSIYKRMNYDLKKFFFEMIFIWQFIRKRYHIKMLPASM